jgi:transposase
MVVVTDHDSRVLARRTFRCKAWDLGAALDWAGERATRAGYAGVTVACEPTGHRWRGHVVRLCTPTVTSCARKSEDLTTDKTDDKDAVLIARLTAQLRCYLPEPVDETWGRLRHLGVRREPPTLPADPRSLYDALADPAGVIAHRLGAFERISWLIEDWDTARAKLADTEARMVAVLEDLELTELACSIQGLSPVGAAAILAETGDLDRFTSVRAVVKHAGLAPRERKSGTFAGRARLTGAGRPHLRAAAWRPVVDTTRSHAAEHQLRYRFAGTDDEPGTTPNC